VFGADGASEWWVCARTDTLEKRMVVVFMCMDQVSLPSVLKAVTDIQNAITPE
jgi:hypothetical protein